MKVCIIGGVGHVGFVFKGLRHQPEARLCGISPGPRDGEVGHLREAVSAAGLHPPAVFADYRTMLDEIKPDVVAVAPIYADTAGVSIEALRRGIHVFSEKPLAVSHEELAALERTYRAGQARLTCMLGLRYSPAVFAAWEAVRAGAIGRVRLLSAQKSYKLGKRPAFYQERAKYGGTIPWVGSHAIDLLHWFAAQPFRSVCASHSTRDNRGNGTMELTAVCSFTLGEEMLGIVNIDYLRPATAGTHGDDRIRVAGTEGVVEVREEQALLINGEAQGERKLDKKLEKPMFVDFLDEIRGHGRCRVTADDAFLTTRACLLARDSADQQGKPLAF